MFSKWIETRRAARMERRVFEELYRMAMNEILETTYCADCDGNCEVCQNDTRDCD